MYCVSSKKEVEHIEKEVRGCVAWPVLAIFPWFKSRTDDQSTLPMNESFEVWR